VTVEEGAGEGGEAASGPTVPDAAKQLAVATTGAISVTLAIVFLFLKYGGSPSAE
jgi:hypothetical protein